MRRIFTLLALALACTALPADAAVTLIATGPGSQTTHSYATPVVVAPVGGPLTFLNQDVQAHNVVSDADGPGDQPWCGRFTGRGCPLFYSPEPQAGGGSLPVAGTENATSGQSYTFRCSIYASRGVDMTGTLVLV